MNQTGYVAGSSSSAGTEEPSEGRYWPLSRLKKAYLDYIGNKREEIDEQIEARRYYHGAHWTADELSKLKKRNQPPVTFNRIVRKINGVVGLIEKMKTDPKAYPRTPKHEAGAELATAVLRYVLDQQQWDSVRPECVREAAINGVSGVEIVIEAGDQGDKEIGLEGVSSDAYFYDPRSFKLDFSDARYQGVGKWADIEEVQATFPDKKDEISSAGQGDSDLTSGSDRDNKWFMIEGGSKRVRLVDIWYQHGNKWCWAIFIGNTILMEGESYLVDEKGKTFCKFLMWSSNVDHEGDRYGFIRDMKSAQDEINHRRSKALHKLSSRRLIMLDGAVKDVEKARHEWARPDGVVVVNPIADSLEGAIKADDQENDFAGEMALMDNAASEIENFGFNPALIGQGVQDMSGRAINLQQQAGIAELGPFTVAYKGWTLRVYRAIWNAVQKHWTSERFIRVTDDEDVAQFIQINGQRPDPMTGQPALVNAIGSLDVDIILDEGPDTVNMMADAYDTLQVMAGKGNQIPLPILFELSPLPLSVKKKLNDLLEKSQQADPALEAAKRIQIEGASAEVEETRSRTALNIAKARESMTPDVQSPQAPEVPVQLQSMKTLAEVGKLEADTEKSRADAFKTIQEARLAPQKMAQEARDRQADRQVRSIPA